MEFPKIKVEDKKGQKQLLNNLLTSGKMSINLPLKLIKGWLFLSALKTMRVGIY